MLGKSDMRAETDIHCTFASESAQLDTSRHEWNENDFLLNLATEFAIRLRPNAFACTEVCFCTCLCVCLFVHFDCDCMRMDRGTVFCAASFASPVGSSDLPAAVNLRNIRIPSGCAGFGDRVLFGMWLVTGSSMRRKE